MTPKSRYAYIAPTYKQAKNIAWDILKEYARKVDGVTFNESELRCDFMNGARITLYGADNPDSLRGIALWGVVFDEYSQQPSEIFSEIIAPALADHEGYAIWIGTPKGKNSFYDLYEYAKSDPAWLAILLTVDDTGLISVGELETQRQIQTQEEFEQEWYCSFEAAIKGAYYIQEISEMRKTGRITKVPHDPTVGVITFWDLGMDDMTSIGFFQVCGREFHMIDYLESHGQPLSYYVSQLSIKAIEEKYNYTAHYLPHDIEVRELGSGTSRREVLERLGIKVQVVPKLSLADGINAARLVSPRVWIDEDKCKSFIEALSQYRQEWDDKKGMYKNHPLHDWTSHAADMYRYFAVAQHKMVVQPERRPFIPPNMKLTNKNNNRYGTPQSFGRTYN